MGCALVRIDEPWIRDRLTRIFPLVRHDTELTDPSKETDAIASTLARTPVDEVGCLLEQMVTLLAEQRPRHECSTRAVLTVSIVVGAEKRNPMPTLPIGIVILVTARPAGPHVWGLIHRRLAHMRVLPNVTTVTARARCLDRWRWHFGLHHETVVNE